MHSLIFHFFFQMPNEFRLMFKISWIPSSHSSISIAEHPLRNSMDRFLTYFVEILLLSQWMVCSRIIALGMCNFKLNCRISCNIFPFHFFFRECKTAPVNGHLLFEVIDHRCPLPSNVRYFCCVSLTPLSTAQRSTQLHVLSLPLRREIPFWPTTFGNSCPIFCLCLRDVSSSIYLDRIQTFVNRRKLKNGKIWKQPRERFIWKYIHLYTYTINLMLSCII